MKLRRIFFCFLILSTLILGSCARQYMLIDKALYPDVQLMIDARNKMIAFSLGIIVDLDIWIRFGGPKIDSASLFLNNNELIWKSVRKQGASGSSFLFYDKPNSYYIQIVPNNDEKPPTLVNNMKYMIIIVFEVKTIEKKFNYYPSLIYLEDDLKSK
jgi:hypothetical protein